MKKRLVLALALFVSVSIASELRADIVFNNFGAADSFSTISGYTIGAGDFWEAGSFFPVSGGSFTLDSIEAAVGFRGGTNQAILSLYSTSAGLPTTFLESATATGLPNWVSGIPYAPSTFTFGGTTVLQESETYAVVASAANTSSVLVFSSNNIGDTGVVYRTNGGSWNTINDDASAFRVNGTVVPEPNTIFLMFGAAMIGLSLASRRRRIA